MPNMIADYCECQSVLISRPERAIIYAMDYALRNALVSERAKNDRTIRKKQASK